MHEEEDIMFKGMKAQRRLAFGVALTLSAGGGLLFSPSVQAAEEHAATIPSSDTAHTAGIDGTTATGFSSDNRITVGEVGASGPTVNGDVVGGSAASDVSNNTLTINSLTLGSGSAIYGGKSINGAATGNTVNLMGGVLGGDVYGGIGRSAHKNTVTIKDGAGAITNIYGGYANAADGSATGNTVNVAGGTFTGGYIMGGQNSKADRTGTVSGNTVTVTGGTMSTGNVSIMGSAAGNADTAAAGNTVNLGAADGTFSSTANLTKAYLYGSYYYHNSAPNITNDSDLIKGNTLNVNAQGISVYGIRNFEKYNFNLTDKNTSGGTLLTTSDGFGMTVKWDNIQLNADKLKTYVGWVNGKNYFTLLHSNTANALKFSEYAERTGTDGDYEYAVRAEGTTTDGIRSATNVTADYNRYQNAKTVYSGEAASDGNIYGGYSNQGRKTTNNELTVKALPSGNLNNVYGAMTDTPAATAHSTYNTVNIESTVGTTRTIGNVYGGYTKATTGDATHNTVNLRGGHITGDVYGGKADGTGVTTNNTVNIEGTGITVGGAIAGGNKTGVDNVVGNTLHVRGTASAKTIEKFDIITFALNAVKAGGDTMLTLDDGDNGVSAVTTTTLDWSKLKVENGTGGTASTYESTWTLMHAGGNDKLDFGTTYDHAKELGAADGDYELTVDKNADNTKVTATGYRFRNNTEAAYTATDQNHAVVWGGRSEKGNTVENNTLTVSGGSITNASHEATVFGGLANNTGADSLAQNNTLKITGGIIDDAYGGMAQTANGRAVKNAAVLDLAAGAPPTDEVRSLTGGFGKTATENTAVVKNGRITGATIDTLSVGVIGGRSDAANGSAAKNAVTVAGGTVTGSVIGGYVHDATGAATENAVTLRGGHIAGNVYGGYAAHNGTAKNNTVNIEGTGTTVTGLISGGNRSEENTLNVRGTATATNLENFNRVTFALGAVRAGSTMLTLTDAAGTDASGWDDTVAIDTDAEGAASTWGSRWTLMENANGINLTRFTAGDRVQGDYEFTLGKAGDATHTVTRVYADGYRFRNAKATYDATDGSHELVWGGRSEKGNTVENNTLTVSGGSITNTAHSAAVHGGLANSTTADSLARNNTLKLSGGTIDQAFGGTAKTAAGRAIGNRVLMDEGSAASVKVVTGGYGATATDNTVEIKGGTISGTDFSNQHVAVLGGHADTDNGTASQNHVAVSGGTINGGVIGGAAKNGTAERNTVTVADGVTITGAVAGGGSYDFSKPDNIGNGSGSYNVVHIGDNVTLSRRTLPADATHSSPYADENQNVQGGQGAFANYNSVSIGTSDYDHNKYIGMDIGGGYGGTANYNTVTLNGTVVSGDVTGGRATNGDAVGNTVSLTGGYVMGKIYGGVVNGTTHHSVNNTLAVRGFNTKVGEIDNASIQNLHFYIPAGTTSDVRDTMLYIKNAPTTGKDLRGMNIGVALAGNRPTLSIGDTVSLIKTYKNNSMADADAVPLTTGDLVNKTTGMQGVSLRYGFDLMKRADNELVAKVNSVALNEQTKSLVETRAASAALINSGADLLTDSSMNAAIEAASSAPRTVPGGSNDFNLWAAQGGSSLRLNSGSHVDAKGWNINLGFAKKAAAGRNTITYGPFLEYGRGTYDSYLDDGTHGDGKTSYFGGGVMAKVQSASGTYVEGSLRAGRVKSDYSGNIAGMNTGYDNSSTYYAAHIGIGQEKELKNGNTIEGYAKYFYAHQGGNTTTLRTGETYEFDSINSNRIRIGTRYTHKMPGSGAFYTGLAYEYEFGSEAGASYQGYSTPSPSLKGSTGILELGYRFTPKESRVSYGVNLMGMTGKRRGITGGVQMTWAF